MSNLKLHEELKNQALRDPLTFLFNRRYLEEALDREISRAQRKNTTIGIILMDLDHFKRFNDSLGHQAGDALLRSFGKFLRENVRGGDIACRYGGEEFFVMLPECSAEELEKRAEEIRSGTKEIRIKYEEEWLGPVTCSLGIAMFPFHGSTASDLVQRADRALYQAKRTGRDRVCMSDFPQIKPTSI
ncbi:MAG TPA: GGDEF domain-containing protein [Acidobacteriota bacterium]|nr:GGDEF domain-containing protein [Acidobacteriota bacterium]